MVDEVRNPSPINQNQNQKRKKKLARIHGSCPRQILSDTIVSY